MRRPLQDLINLDEPGWPVVRAWIDDAKTSVEVLPPGELGATELEALQVTTRSPMGAIAYATGGLLLDGGWLEVLGASHPRLPWSITGLTRELGFWPDRDSPPALLVVAVDVLGGVFAVDGGPLGAPGRVHYFAPDDPEWMDCGNGYSGWLQACIAGSLPEFYAELRWPGWETEVAALAPDRGIQMYPPPWTAESKPLVNTDRRAVPLLEVVRLAFEVGGQLRGS